MAVAGLSKTLLYLFFENQRAMPTTDAGPASGKNLQKLANSFAGLRLAVKIITKPQT